MFLTELPLPISLTHNGDDAPQNYVTVFSTQYVIKQDILLDGKLVNPILSFLVYRNIFENHINLLLRIESR